LKCPDCEINVKPTLWGNGHMKFREWVCPEHGIFKNQYLINGEIEREWKK